MRQKALLPVREMCGWAGFSKTTFYKERKAGRLRTVKVGRRTFVRIEDAEQWLANLPAV